MIVTLVVDSEYTNDEIDTSIDTIVLMILLFIPFDDHSMMMMMMILLMIFHWYYWPSIDWYNGQIFVIRNVDDDMIPVMIRYYSR